MRMAFLERWRVYVVWLGVGVSGIRPDELWLTLGSVRALLPLARQVAEALGPWLAEAPEETLRRLDWLSWEVRYWALAVCLARIGQLYVALEQKGDAAQSERLFKGALARVWQQALPAHRAA